MLAVAVRSSLPTRKGGKVGGSELPALKQFFGKTAMCSIS
jgi:hypothetical protein